MDVKSILHREELELEDVIALATIDYSDFNSELVDEMYALVYDILSTYGLEYDEKDPNYPNNPYMWGYCLEGVDFLINYTGVAGHYWGNTIAYDVRDNRNYLE